MAALSIASSLISSAIVASTFVTATYGAAISTVTIFTDGQATPTVQPAPFNGTATNSTSTCTESTELSSVTGESTVSISVSVSTLASIRARDAQADGSVTSGSTTGDRSTIISSVFTTVTTRTTSDSKNATTPAWTSVKTAPGLPVLSSSSSSSISTGRIPHAMTRRPEHQTGHSTRTAHQTGPSARTTKSTSIRFGSKSAPAPTDELSTTKETSYVMTTVTPAATTAGDGSSHPAAHATSHHTAPAHLPPSPNKPHGPPPHPAGQPGPNSDHYSLKLEHLEQLLEGLGDTAVIIPIVDHVGSWVINVNNGAADGGAASPAGAEGHPDSVHPSANDHGEPNERPHVPIHGGPGHRGGPEGLGVTATGSVVEKATGMATSAKNGGSEGLGVTAGGSTKAEKERNIATSTEKEVEWKTVVTSWMTTATSVVSIERPSPVRPTA
ncbi:hypothetical protein LTR37_016924 [Vermiconidia calcicola]|uniref:Uncharacterized protein n=1 Tax=Vermiconidia calcicola TaxID=1690605 RepID=A0ACC3MLB3_9PEZI|nr:hypothetical protein LTR37_016924 [Vermiconidia calcicola]